MNSYITGDKVFFHTEKIYNWLNGREITPITVQFHPSNKCNQKCIYCISENQKDNALITCNDALKIIDKLSSIDVQGITYSGGGEPTLHPDFGCFINYSIQKNIKVGVVTNGVFLDDQLIHIIVKNSTWLRFSIDSVVEDTYYEHRGHRDLENVINNVRKVVEKKKLLKSPITIGAQTVVTEKNYQDINITANILKKIGVDYYQVRPAENLTYNDELYLSILNEMIIAKNEYENETYKVIISDKWKLIESKALKRERAYRKCWCYPFIGTIDAHGDIYICCHMAQIKESDKFCYGNLISDPINRILNKREKIAKKINLALCPIACRGSLLNLALNRVKYKQNHDYFL